MNNLDSYDSSDLNDNIDDYYDYALVDSEVMNTSTVNVYNDLLKPEAPIEPIPSIASSLMRTVELFFLLIIGMYLFSATLGLILLGIEKLLSVFGIIWTF
tara:strand:- start:275 stop:574 length:300 start_codon:yes stop_codon:yes gene_type:complete